jgi:DNA-binding CsgD family transcriptional regulator
VNVVTQEKIHRVWDELSDFEANQSEQAAARLMACLCELGNAWNATWAGAIRMDGDRRQIDPSFLLPMRGVGTFRTHSFRRELPPEWFESAFYDVQYGSIGTSDAVFVAFPLNRDCESHFGFYSCKTFTDEEIALLTYALRGIKWFHRRLMLSRGLLMSSSPLTPTEQKVLQLLLTEASEKHIAQQVEIATSTVHQHVVSIYRKFGVSSRAGLMSLWLKGGN